jgi:hypothetical protein
MTVWSTTLPAVAGDAAASGPDWATIIAVAGTLLGGALTGLMQWWIRRGDRREARADSRREESLSALVALVEGCADHRQSMRVVGAHKLAHAGPDVLEAAETQMRATRSALNGPLLRVQILMPGLADLADQAVKATFSMRDPSTDEQLEQRRLASLNLNSQLVAAARLHFGDNR